MGKLSFDVHVSQTYSDECICKKVVVLYKIVAIVHNCQVNCIIIIVVVVGFVLFIGGGNYLFMEIFMMFYKNKYIYIYI